MRHSSVGAGEHSRAADHSPPAAHAQAELYELLLAQRSPLAVLKRRHQLGSGSRPQSALAAAETRAGQAGDGDGDEQRPQQQAIPTPEHGAAGASAAATVLGAPRTRAQAQPTDAAELLLARAAHTHGGRSRSANARFHKLMEEAQRAHDASAPQPVLASSATATNHARPQPASSESDHARVAPSGPQDPVAAPLTDKELAVLELRQLRLESRRLAAAASASEQLRLR
jgi:hypothetical protein